MVFLLFGFYFSFLCFDFGVLTFQGAKETAFALGFSMFSIVELGDRIIKVGVRAFAFCLAHPCVYMNL